MKAKRYFIPFLLLPILFNSCTGCVKKVSRKVAETSIAAVEGVTDVLDENAEKLGETTGTIAIKVLKGAGKALDSELKIHAENIQNKNGEVVLTDIDNIDIKQISSYYNNIVFEQNATNGVSVKYVGKLDSISVFDTYLSFSKIGIYDCKIIVSNNSNQKIMEKEVGITIDSIPQNKIVSFYTDSLNLQPLNELFFTVNVIEQK